MRNKPACIKSRMLSNLMWIRELYLAGGKDTADIDRDIVRIREQVKMIGEEKKAQNEIH